MLNTFGTNHKIAYLEDSLGRVHTLFDKKHEEASVDVTQLRPVSELEKRASADSFDLERFKDRLYNLSQTV